MPMAVGCWLARTSFMVVLALAVLLIPSINRADGIWISREELRAIPTDGEAWASVKKAADANAGHPNLADQNQTSDVRVLARALVYARTGETRYRDEVEKACMAAIGFKHDGRTLALARNLCAYVVAADLVGFRDPRFTEWLRRCRTEVLQDRTLVSTHEMRPNNWGTHAGASRLAIALYLGEEEEVKRVAQVFKGYLGDRAAYAGFRYGDDLSWQADPNRPVAVNPKGAMKNGHSIDGALPEEMRRGGPFRWPPSPTGYPWGALQGAIVQAEMLHRHGYPAYEWQDKAILRAVNFLYRAHWEPAGDDQWLVWIINKRYGTTYPTNVQSRPGKNMGWTSWTHSP